MVLPRIVNCFTFFNLKTTETTASHDTERRGSGRRELPCSQPGGACRPESAAHNRGLTGASGTFPPPTARRVPPQTRPRHLRCVKSRGDKVTQLAQISAIDRTFHRLVLPAGAFHPLPGSGQLSPTGDERCPRAAGPSPPCRPWHSLPRVMKNKLATIFSSWKTCQSLAGLEMSPSC